MGQKKVKLVKKEEEKAEKKEAVTKTKEKKNQKPKKKAIKETRSKKEEASREPRARSKKYLEARKKVDREKFYPLKEAISLAKETSLSKFIGNLEAHLVLKKIESYGEVSFPYLETKKKKVGIADTETIKKIEKGEIDFDLLLASPKMMPKLVPHARTLGPKGLMPNPKNGTLVDDPEKAKKELEKKETVKIKTEKKAPLVHLVVGKLDQPEKELIANVEALIKHIGVPKIKKLVLAATMGPGIKVQL